MLEYEDKCAEVPHRDCTQYIYSLADLLLYTSAEKIANRIREPDEQWEYKDMTRNKKIW